MSALLFELFRTGLGIFCGLLAIAFAISTFRLIVFGRDAYRSNRRITPSNPFQIWRGNLREGVEDIDRRASHGVAFDIRTGSLQEQRRLSTEAIDDVIGRRAG